MAETVEAGGVRIKFEGTTEQLVAEIQKLTGSIKQVGGTASAAGASVSQSSAGMAAAFKNVSAQLQLIGGIANQVSGLLGGMGTTAGEVAHGVGQLATAVASGSPLNVGIALVGIGIEHMAKEWKLAKDMAEASLTAMVEGGREVQASIGNLLAAQAGLSGDQLKAQQEIEFQQLRQGDLQARINELLQAGVERWMHYEEIGIRINQGQKDSIELYHQLNSELDDVNAALSGAEGDLTSINTLQDQIKKNAQAEANARKESRDALLDMIAAGDVDIAYAKLIKDLDAHPGGATGTAVSDVMGEADPWKQLNERLYAAQEALKKQSEAVEANAAGIDAANLMWDDYLKNLKAESAARADLVGSIATAATQGSAGQALGSLGGAAAGGAIDVALTGGGDGMIGAAIGGALGSLLGGILDSLEPVVEIVQILLDACAGLVDALRPIFEPLVLVAKVLARIIVEGLGDAILNLAEPVGMFLQVIAEVLMLLEPFITLFVNLAVNFLLLTGLFEILTPLFEQMALGLLYAIEATYEFYNGIVGAVNAIIELIRTLPGFEDYGEKLKERDFKVPEGGRFDFSGDDIDENTRATDENTAATRAVGEQLTNMPRAWKVSLARYQSITAIESESQGLSGVGTSGGGGGGGRTTVINIGGKTVAAVLEQGSRFQNVKQRGVGGGSGGRGPAGDD